MISPLTRSHVPLLVPCHAFCIFDGCVGEWRRERGGNGGEEEEQHVVLCDVCCEITAVSPEETQTAQCESTSSSLCSCLPGPDIILDFYSACRTPPFPFEVISILHISPHCFFFYFFHFTECVHINMEAEWVTSRWSQKPVVPQSELLLNDTSAPCGLLSCYWIMK